MVADKSKSDINLNSQLECGDGSKIITNLNTSSSDESTKCRSDDDYMINIDRSIDSSVKDESDDEPRNFDKTYLCNKSKIVCDCSGDAKFKKNKQTLKLIKSNSDDESLTSICSKNRIWKSPNVLSLSNHFDKNDNSLQVCDIKIENSAVEDLVDKNNNSFLTRIRNYLADYQELRGISRREYTYSTLLRIMGQSIGQCLVAIFYVLLNVPQFLEIILHIIRFMLDNLIDIKNTMGFRKTLLKTVIFLLEVSSLYMCFIFVLGLVVSPVINMSFEMFSKIMLQD